jgi:hypothetical protein
VSGTFSFALAPASSAREGVSVGGGESEKLITNGTFTVPLTANQ